MTWDFARNYGALYSVLSRTRKQTVRGTHPAIVKFVTTKAYRPADWHLLVLEMPHLVPSDATNMERIAYWQNEHKAGTTSTITTIGKYLRRHFPDLPDHELRDFVAQFRPGEMKITTDMEEMVHKVQYGPSSCMQWNSWQDENDALSWDEHPYNVYDPEYGWGMAYREKDKVVLGRCLVHIPSKVYVRSYLRGKETSQALGTDDTLELWLKGQGYSKHSGWPQGTKLAWLEVNGLEPFVPYIDGSSSEKRNVTKGTYDGRPVLLIDEDGEYCCDNTDGTADYSDRLECDCCGAVVRSTNTVMTRNRGAHNYETEEVCDNCFNYYTYVPSYVDGSYRGRRYVHEDDVIAVGGNYYDQYGLPDHITYNETLDEYVDSDDGFFADDEWWPAEEITDSETMHRGTTYVGDPDDPILREDAVYCQHSQEWIREDESFRLADGLYVHEDSIEEYLLEQCSTVAELHALCGTSDEAEEIIADVLASLSWQEKMNPEPQQAPTNSEALLASLKELAATVPQTQT